MNAIERNHLAQALLFCGPRGVGKTTCARILAKQINKDGTERDEEDFAFNIFELDAASNNSVDDIRNLIDQVRIPPQVGKYKVYIIDEVHMLSQSAFNAFLKTLEEPPKHAIFILATTEKQKIIPTILSRCQIFDFKRITVKDAANYLKNIALSQGVNAEEGALHIIAQKADGAMRDALSIFDRVVSFSGKELTRKAVTENLNVLDYDTYFEATDLALEHQIPQLLLLLNNTLALGFDGHHFISGLASHFRDLMVCKHKDTLQLLEVGEMAEKQYLEQSRKTSDRFLLMALGMANECDLNYKSSKNQRLLVELALMKIASIDFDVEKKKANGSGLDESSDTGIAPASFFNDIAAPTPKLPVNVTQVPTSHALDRLEPPGLDMETEDENPLDTQVGDLKNDTVELTTTVAVSGSPNLKKIDIKSAGKRVSGLSISSLKAKKAHHLSKKEDTVEESELPKEPFSEQDMQRHWTDFVKKIDLEGKKILASSLTTDTPKLFDESTIWIELPNDTMKKEVEREQYDLMNYLKEKLNNYSIHLRITVNEKTAKRFAFTPEEKYQKLREKNPAIDLLRKEFDLDF